jgi:hypothetical protein
MRRTLPVNRTRAQTTVVDMSASADILGVCFSKPDLMLINQRRHRIHELFLAERWNRRTPNVDESSGRSPSVEAPGHAINGDLRERR